MTATARLRSTRSRLTALIASIAAVGLGVLALATTIVEARSRADEATVYRQGLASRLAALIYPDESDQWIVDGVIDDSAWQTADAVLVANRAGTVLYQSTRIGDFTGLLADGVADADEVGTQGTMTVDGTTLAAAAAPYWDLDQIEGAVLVAWVPEAPVGQSRLRILIWSAAAGLTALSALAAWLVAGRLIEPVGEALDREERFLSTAAHDLRTPLGRVRALADSAMSTARHLESGPATRQLRGELRRLASVVEEASDSANDLLLAGRLDATQLQMRQEPVRLDQLVAGFESVVANLVVDTRGPVEVIGDQLLLRHAIGNVLSNAGLHGRPAAGPALIEVWVWVRGNSAVVTVADNGPGLGSGDPAELFDRYAEGVQRAARGSGLGLWITRTVIEGHGGSVGAFNKTTGPGAAFELTLPLLPSRSSHE